MTTDLKNTNNGKLEVKYPRVYKDIRSRIEKGILTGALPGVKQLALEYDVNFMTVNKAVKKLETDGLVYRIPRKGTYVKRQYSVAVCFNDPNPEIMAVPVYNRVVMAAQRYFSEQNCPMFLEGSLLHKENVVSILRKRIDGFLLFYNDSFPMPERLLHLPCVRVMGSKEFLPKLDHIGYNNQVIGKLAAEYVLERGCRSGAYIGAMGRSLFDERREIFAKVLRANGADYHEFPCEWTYDYSAVQTQMEQLLAMDKLPDAIFAHADTTMVDVCTFLYRHGIQPGKDVILVACNNSGPIIRSIPDTFASIDLRSQEIGRLAAEQLLKRIVNPKLSRKIEFLDPRMVLPEEIINVTDRDSIAIEI